MLVSASGAPGRCGHRRRHVRSALARPRRRYGPGRAPAGLKKSCASAGPGVLASPYWPPQCTAGRRSVDSVCSTRPASLADEDDVGGHVPSALAGVQGADRAGPQNVAACEPRRPAPCAPHVHRTVLSFPGPRRGPLRQCAAGSLARAHWLIARLGARRPAAAGASNQPPSPLPSTPCAVTTPTWGLSGAWRRAVQYVTGDTLGSLPATLPPSRASASALPPAVVAGSGGSGSGSCSASEPPPSPGSSLPCGSGAGIGTGGSAAASGRSTPQPQPASPAAAGSPLHLPGRALVRGDAGSPFGGKVAVPLGRAALMAGEADKRLRISVPETPGT
jgi:hypothetical protein